MSECFTLYRSVWDGIKGLPDETALRLLKALFGYALDGIEPELQGLEQTVFTSWRANVDASRARQEAGKLGGRPKKSMVSDEKTMVSDLKTMVSDDKTIVLEKKPTITKTITETETITDTDTKTGKEKGTREKGTKFTPPTVEQVKDYCNKRGNAVDPEAFTAFYASKGWKVGKSPMKDWKAAVRTWERRTPGQGMLTHSYDFEALERELIENG